MSDKNDGLKIIHSLNEQQLIVLRDLLINKMPLSKQELVDLMGEVAKPSTDKIHARRQSDPMATTLAHCINLVDEAFGENNG